MSEVTIFHYNRCSKSRAALSILEEKNINPKVRKYLEENPPAEELKEILKKLQIKAVDLIRKSEAIYKENYKGKDFSEEEWIEIMEKHPRLIQRPIVIKGDKAVIGRPPELINDFLENS